MLAWFSFSARQKAAVTPSREIKSFISETPALAFNTAGLKLKEVHGSNLTIQVHGLEHVSERHLGCVQIHVFLTSMAVKSAKRVVQMGRTTSLN